MGDPAQMKKATQAIDRLFELALGGDEKVAVQAMKVLLDKVMSSPKAAEETEENKAPSVHIVIENATDKPEITIEGETIEHEES
jgi:hypothetical protein